MLEEIIHQVVDTVQHYGYPGIFAMMFLESTFFPIPSELVMIPAGYLAHEGQMNIWILLLLGVLGSIGGAMFNYYFAMFLGRNFIIKYHKYLLINEKSLIKLETFFAKHGHISTFTGRLIPVARHLISIPAGLARMNMGKFVFYTATGSAIWVAVLIGVGYFIGKNQALAMQYMHSITIITVVVMAVLIAAYVFYYRWKSKRDLQRELAIAQADLANAEANNPTEN